MQSTVIFFALVIFKSLVYFNIFGNLYSCTYGEAFWISLWTEKD